MLLHYIAITHTIATSSLMYFNVADRGLYDGMLSLFYNGELLASLQVCAQILIDTFTDYQFPQDCPLKEIRLVIFDRVVYSKFVEFFIVKQRQVESAKTNRKVLTN